MSDQRERIEYATITFYNADDERLADATLTGNIRVSLDPAQYEDIPLYGTDHVARTYASPKRPVTVSGDSYSIYLADTPRIPGVEL